MDRLPFGPSSKCGTSRSIGVVALALVAVASGAASAQSSDPVVASLEGKLQDLEGALAAREEAIADLLRRVEELESRLTAGALPLRPDRSEVAESAEAAEMAAPAEETRPDSAPAAPGRIEVDEETVATALERALVREGAIVLPPGVFEVEPSFTYRRFEADQPIFLSRDGETLLGQFRQDEFATALTVRAGLPFETEIALGIPYSFKSREIVAETGFGRAFAEENDASGFGDLTVRIRKGLLDESGWQPQLTADLSWDTNFGQSDGGVDLGSGFNEVIGRITASKSYAPLVFVGSLSYTHAFENDDIQPGAQVGISLGTVLATSPETSVRFFVDQDFIREAQLGGDEVPGSDAVAAEFIVGASTILNRRALLDVQLGIGLTASAPDYTLSVALPIRF